MNEVDRSCVDLYKEFDRGLDGKLDSMGLINYSKKLLSDGGYPHTSDELFEISMDELGMRNNNQLSFKDFKTFVSYVLKKLQWFFYKVYLIININI